MPALGALLEQRRFRSEWVSSKVSLRGTRRVSLECPERRGQERLGWSWVARLLAGALLASCLSLGGPSMKVRDLMTTEVVLVQESDSIARVRRLLGEGRFHALPAVDEWGYLKGIVTSTDFVEILGEDARVPVRQVMQRRVYTLPDVLEAEIVARFMGKHRIRHVVVLRGGKVHGILSSFDLLRALAECGLKPSDQSPVEEDMESWGVKLLQSAPAGD